MNTGRIDIETGGAYRGEPKFETKMVGLNTFEVSDPATGACLRGNFDTATVYEIQIPTGGQYLLKQLLEDATICCWKRLSFSETFLQDVSNQAIAITWDARQGRNWLLAHVNMWATVPANHPVKCGDLWRHNEQKGWTYLTEKGRKERAENLRVIEVYEDLIDRDIHNWAETAAESIMEKLSEG